MKKRRKMGFIKKYSFILLSSFLLFFAFFSGCIMEKPKTDSEKLVGTWISEDSNFRSFKFFSDGTCLINEYELKGTYYINNKGKLIINQTDPKVDYVYTYQLNTDGTKLTISDDETGDYHSFRKK